MSQQDPTGHMLLAGVPVVGSGTAVRAIDPNTDEELEPLFARGDAEDVDRACACAEEAFATYRTLDRTTVQ